MHSPSYRLFVLTLGMALCLTTSVAAQVTGVTTYHNDNSRTGQNTQEIVLAPGNVNSTHFGKVFSTLVDGNIYAQPLYVANVQNIPNVNGTHNVLYVVTEHDSLYAIDADSGAVLWKKSFINPGAGITTVSTTDVGCTDMSPEIGITSTPVIDLASGTLYLVAKTKENGVIIQRLHGIDIVGGGEKFGGPLQIAASVSGTGSGNVGGTVSFDATKQLNRAALMLENGHVVIAWGSHCDVTPYHGWVLSYNATTLAPGTLPEGVINVSPNGGQGGIWMSGDAPAADASGNIFIATGNGTYDGTAKHDFGDSILRYSGPSNGQFTLTDWFTPANQSTLDLNDTDVASGGLILLPDLPAPSPHPHLLVLMGKEGTIYLVDRDNMGHYCSGCANDTQTIVQEIPLASSGIWGSPSYWNGSVYWGGGRDDGGPADHLKAFSFNANNSGKLSALPTSQSAELFNFSTAAPMISANGNTNGILWILDNSSWQLACCQVLYAYDATNLGTMLYNSNQAPNNRDQSGGAIKFTAPLIANGKVYAGGQASVTAWGPITPQVATPTFSPAPGSYNGTVNVVLSDATPNAAIYYTTDGSTPTSLTSTLYQGAIAVSTTTRIRAIGTLNGYSDSLIADGTYTISTGSPGINFGGGFTNTGMQLNGSAAFSGTRLRLTNGAVQQAGSAFFTTAMNINNFITDFSFQMTNPQADGMTFTIQNSATTALGLNGGGLGFGTDTAGTSCCIPKSIAVKFDIYSNNGEGADSTGLYLNGTSPTTPAIDMTSSGVSLLSGDVFNVHMTYDGTTLTMTITDASNAAKTFTTSWPVNIASTIGSSTAFIGFTGGTGGLTVTQDIITWTFTSGSSQGTVATPTFSPASPYTGGATTVTISDSTSGASIFYCQDTTNTCTPNTPGSSVQFSSTGYIRAQATASGMTPSAIASWSGTYAPSTVATPTFSPASPYTGGATTVTISDSTSGASIFYCQDTTNTCTPNTPGSSVQFSSTGYIRAQATASGMTPSAIASWSGTYAPPAAMPTFQPSPGRYTGPQLVALSDVTPNAKIYYTTNGSAPTTGSTLYSSPIPVTSGNTTIKAIAVANQYANSPVASGLYQIRKH